MINDRVVAIIFVRTNDNLEDMLTEVFLRKTDCKYSQDGFKLL